MDCQKLLIYGLVALIGLYFLRETCGLKLPFVDTFEGYESGNGNMNVYLENLSSAMKLKLFSMLH